MALVERPPSEQESLSAISRSESSLSGSSEPAGYAGLLLDDDDDESDVWSSSTGDMHSIRESVFSAVGVQGVTDTHSNRRSTNEGVPLPGGAINKKELLQQNKLRRHIHQLREKKRDIEEEVKKQGESLVACRDHLKTLHGQNSELEYRIMELDGQMKDSERGWRGEGGERRKEGERGRAVATIGFLRAQLERVKDVISREEDVERKLVEKLQEAQLQLSGAVMAYSEYEEMHEELRETERQTQTAKNLQALQRLQTQTRMRANADRSKRAKERTLENTLKLQEAETKAAIKRAQVSQAEGRAFLRQTLERQKIREAEEGRREREEMERKMRAALSLKKNTESSAGTIQALQMLKEERDRKERSRELGERRRAVLDGENPDEVLLRKKREKEFSKKKAQFEENRRQKHVDIVSKLLEEQKHKRTNERLASKLHWQDHWQIEGEQQRRERHRDLPQKTHRFKRGSHLQESEEAVAIISVDDEPVGKGKRDEGGSDSADGAIGASGERVRGDVDSNEMLAKPEINGLWSLRRSKDVDPYEDEQEDVIDDEGQRGRRERGKGRSKLEQKMLTDVVDNLKQSVVKRQVAAGREFKGCPFTSKPEVAEFKDFSPGESLKLRLTLTNVTYTVNYCKLVGVSPHLRDFITVNFNPPGAMSAGLTCQMVVIFEPKLNEDLEGEIQMLSQTGPFSVPVRCSTRKCIVQVEEGGGGVGDRGEVGEVDFGKVCIGETVRRCVVLHNEGVLFTDFTVTANTREEEELMTTAISGSMAEEGPPDSIHPVTSVPSVMSVMSEVRGDWGPLGRVKDDIRPVSRSTSELPQVESGTKSPSDGKSVEPPTPNKPVKPVTREVQPVPLEMTEKGAMSDSGVTEEETQDGGKEGGVEVVKMSTAGMDVVPAAITVGKNQRGCLKGYSSCGVELVYTPLRTSLSSQLFTIHFSQPGVPPIIITAKGEGSALPIYVTRDTIDLQLCTISRLYQDSIKIHNRGSTALRVSFILPPEVAPHLEILPPHGLVQGASSFSAQIKFLPLSGILKICEKFFKNDCLTIPAEIHVTDQVCPVSYTIRARVTPSDLEFSSMDIDFGTCTIHESVVTKLEITNTSILPQEFGFVHLPECVDVQPNDGFGTLLPQETILLDVIFSTSKPRDYCFELTCLTEINSSFKIACRGKGVLPALKLSENIVNFATTPLNSVAAARISITNPKLSRLSSPVIRGGVLPQGPKAFEFSVPDGVPMEISPRVGTIGLDETVSVELCYSPHLPHSTIREEAMRLAIQASQKRSREAAEDRAAQLRESESTVTEKKGKRSSSRTGSQSKTVRAAVSSRSGRESENSDRRSGRGGERGATGEVGSGVSSRMSAGGDGVKRDGEVKVEMPVEGSEVWQQATAELLNEFQNQTDQFSITCFVSSEAPKSELDTVPYRPEDTLYVEVSVPIVRPALQVISNEGNTLNFGAVAVGDNLSKQITVKNISDSSIKLFSSPLDPHGPFDVRNALRCIDPIATHTLLIRFSPLHGGKYHEVMTLSYSKSCGMELRVIGEAVEPNVVLEPDTDRMDFGHTYAGDTSVKKLALRNTCSLVVRYRISLEGRNEEKAGFRASNYSGQPVFDCIPFQGRIEPDGMAEVNVSFSADHQSFHFSDTVHIDINDSPTYSLAISGHAWSSTMYILGGDNGGSPLISQRKRADFESMAVKMPSPEDDPTDTAEPVLVLFHSRGCGGVREGEGEEEGGDEKRELVIGCIKTASVKKNTGDFTVEPIPSSNPHSKCFSFDPTKSSVEPGSTRTLTITYHPPKTADQPVIEASTKIILKGDTTAVHRLLLRAIMSQ